MKALLRTLALLGLGGLGTPAAAQDYGTIGFGWGIPYATLGLNIDIKITRDIYLTESVGSGFTDTGYAAGGRYYVHSLSDTARVRATALYGVYSGVMYRPTDQQGNAVNKKGEDFASLALGIGLEWMSNGEGFDVDVLYVDTSSARKRATEIQNEGYLVRRTGADNISIGVGYRRRID